MPRLTTPESLIAAFGEDLAFVAEEKPATVLPDFISQLHVTTDRLEEAGIAGAEELETAAIYLTDATHTQSPQERQTLLKQAAKHLRNVDDMVDEYRLMV